jgi:hypothetical protein
MSSLWTKGRRFFTVASVLLVVVAGAHTTGMLSTPSDPAAKTVEAAMRAYHTDLGLGMSPSAWDVMHTLGFTMSILLVALGLQNLVTVHLAGHVAGLVRRLSLVNVVFMGALAALSWTYRIPPPFVSFVVVTLLFVGAWIEAGSAE